MKKIVPLVLTAVALISVAGAASAQGVYLDFGPNPGYGPPGPGYGPGYGPPPPGYGPGYGPPGPTIAATGNVVVDGGTISPADFEHGTDASRAGLCRTVSASRTAGASRSWPF